MSRPLRWYDYITVNIYFLGLAVLNQSNGLIQPLLVALFVGETLKGSYYGRLRLGSLMVALLFQAFWGALSDRSTLPGGRRRPFIAFGTLFLLFFIVFQGALFTAEGTSGFAWLFLAAILIAMASNLAQAAAQGLIPDLVPLELRGRFSGVKAVMDIPLPVILVSLTIGRFLASGETWLAVAVICAVLVAGLLVTLLVPEKRLAQAPGKMDWEPYLRLLLMTGTFAAIIIGLGEGIRLISRLWPAEADLSSMLFGMGLAGLLAMVIAVFLGVRLGVRISLGVAAVNHTGFTWWVANRLAFIAGLVNLSTFTIFYFQSRLGYSQMQAAGPAAQLVLVVGVMVFLAALAGGWLGDRFGHRRLLFISGFGGAAGVVIILLTRDLAVIAAGGAVIGAASGLFYASNWALGTELVPQDEAARFLGISNLAGAGAGAIGAYIGGPIADFFTYRAPGDPGLGYVLLFGIYGLLFLFSTLALLRIEEPNGRGKIIERNDAVVQ